MTVGGLLERGLATVSIDGPGMGEPSSICQLADKQLAVVSGTVFGGSISCGPWSPTGSLTSLG